MGYQLWKLGVQMSHERRALLPLYNLCTSEVIIHPDFLPQQGLPGLESRMLVALSLTADPDRPRPGGADPC